MWDQHYYPWKFDEPVPEAAEPCYPALCPKAPFDKSAPPPASLSSATEGVVFSSCAQMDDRPYPAASVDANIRTSLQMRETYGERVKITWWPWKILLDWNYSSRNEIYGPFGNFNMGATGAAVGWGLGDILTTNSYLSFPTYYRGEERDCSNHFMNRPGKSGGYNP